MKPLTACLAVLGAAAAGVAVGLLFAPRKGSETRENIKEYLKKHLPDIKGKRLDDLADSLADELKAD